MWTECKSEAPQAKWREGGWHGPPERGSLRQGPGATRPPHMSGVHNTALLTLCSDKSIAIEWCILPFKRSRSWRLETQGLAFLFLRERIPQTAFRQQLLKFQRCVVPIILYHLSVRLAIFLSIHPSFCQSIHHQIMQIYFDYFHYNQVGTYFTAHMNAYSNNHRCFH
jgi:hypothetical protein